jgi:hypothetical protein
VTRLLAVLATGALALAIASASLAGMSEPPPKAVNLVATAKVKKALRSAFLKNHRRWAPSKIKGPLKGTTYYGRYGTTKYAFATFSIPKFGTQDQPEVFRKRPGHAWRDLGDTGGEICKSVIPLPLIKVWKLKAGSPGCYYPP